MARKLDQTNFVSLTLSLASIAFLLVSKCVVQPFLDKQFPKRKVAMPWEFILVGFFALFNLSTEKTKFFTFLTHLTFSANSRHSRLRAVSTSEQARRLCDRRDAERAASPEYASFLVNAPDFLALFVYFGCSGGFFGIWKGWVGRKGVGYEFSFLSF